MKLHTRIDYCFPSTCIMFLIFIKIFASESSQTKEIFVYCDKILCQRFSFYIYFSMDFSCFHLRIQFRIDAFWSETLIDIIPKKKKEKRPKVNIHCLYKQKARYTFLQLISTCFHILKLLYDTLSMLWKMYFSIYTIMLSFIRISFEVFLHYFFKNIKRKTKFIK